MSDHPLEDELLEAVRGARPRRSSGESLSPDGAEAQAVLERVLSARRARQRPRSFARRALGGVPGAAAIGAVLIVVAVAVVSLHGRAPSRKAGLVGHAVRGEIVDRDGQALAEPVPEGIGHPRRVGYPEGGLLAQVLGTMSSQTGQSGLEAYYNAELSSGDTLKTSLDLKLQAAGQQALQRAIDDNRPADAGAFVALDPDNGQVYAMGSLPTYDPTLSSRAGTNSLINRATEGAQAVGSAFAPITALAALESGAWGVGDTYDDTGQFCIDGECRRNYGGAAHGVLDLVNAIRVSDPVFFDNLGALTNSAEPQGGAIQRWARALGIGGATGIDLPDAVSGTLPSLAWQAERNRLEAECENATGPFAGKSRHPAAQGGCGIAVVPEQGWSVGDNINLAVGQGDVQVSPVQLAVAYAAIANGGTVVRPHLGMDIEQPGGAAVQTIDPAPVRDLNVNSLYLDAIREGLRAASSQPGGTSADVFGDFPEQVYGETGTAQYVSSAGRAQDDAWYAGFVPASATSKPIVVVVTVSRGGFGDHAAAPVARQILSQWFFGRPGPWVAGKVHTL
ncbi:MAG TPA: penicillin-binding transpeptidase domain-containing protein [Solirubrobacteraceae bacterium]|nr:penicillin-binding transpeptidase domain-containing protein [Solirubrobacteraceae bacterium]